MSLIDCRECHGDGCGHCEDGVAECDERGCSYPAAEVLDFSEEGGPREWFACETHAKEMRAARQRLAIEERI
jgi:hypothetical protein